MKLINALRIFVAILFLISPIEILGEKVPKYTKMNHDKRKLEENENYIIAKYGKETKYNRGKFKNMYRKNVDYIMYKGEMIDPNKQFTIEENGIIQIYPSEDITSLDRFFFSSLLAGDPNSYYIISIDLSHFDSSSINSLYRMFGNCSSLEEINFGNFDTSKVTDMAYMFYGCSNLKSLDLSNFDTSNLQTLNYMFVGCKSLKYLDISNFNFLLMNEYKINSINLVFSNENSLKYINLYNTRIDDNDNKIKSKIIDILENSAIVCQNNDIVTDIEEKTFIYKCCDFNFETSSCDPDNYIKVKYKKDVTYSYGLI